MQLTMTQAKPLTALRLSHNDITAFGVAMLALAVGACGHGVYVFHRSGRRDGNLFGTCWLRTEQHEVEAPEALLASIAAWDMIRLIGTTWAQRDFGRGRSPSSATA